MKATKIFMMAALALTFAACSNDDIDLAQQPANGEITITATLDANDGATTRVLTGPDGSGNINSEWRTTDQFAILFHDGSARVKRIATVKEIKGTTVTITFTVSASLANNTPCTIVYPASAVTYTSIDASAVSAALAAQDGTIENCPEVRVGTAEINKTDHNLSSVTKLETQNAIFKFTVRQTDGTTSINVKPLTVTIGTQNYVITPTTATDVLYVALPAVTSQKVFFSATGNDSKIYDCSKDGVSFSDGKYYQSTLKMTQLQSLTVTDPNNKIDGNPKTIYYKDSETWRKAIENHPAANAGWRFYENSGRYWPTFTGYKDNATVHDENEHETASQYPKDNTVINGTHTFTFK